MGEKKRDEILAMKDREAIISQILASRKEKGNAKVNILIPLSLTHTNALKKYTILLTHSLIHFSRPFSLQKELANVFDFQEIECDFRNDHISSSLSFALHFTF